MKIVVQESETLKQALDRIWNDLPLQYGGNYTAWSKAGDHIIAVRGKKIGSTNGKRRKK